MHPEGVAGVLARTCPDAFNSLFGSLCIKTARQFSCQISMKLHCCRLQTTDYGLLTPLRLSHIITYWTLRANNCLASYFLRQLIGPHFAFHRFLLLTRCLLDWIASPHVLFSAMRFLRLTPHPQKEVPTPYPSTPTIPRKRVVRASVPCI